MPRVEAVAVPEHLQPDQLRGKVAVVIDILRASTTIVRALDVGARCVVPVASIDGARMIAADRPGSVIGGERNGVKPEGFHLGNSPAEYTPGRIAGKAVIMSTTNGTRALHLSDQAETILVGSITNAAALCETLAELGRDVVFVCSGTDGQTSLEDCIGAGLMIDRLGCDADDSALLMLNAFDGAIRRCGNLRSAIGSSFHARRLGELGFGADIDAASDLDASRVVPMLDIAAGELTGVESGRIQSRAGETQTSLRGAQACTKSS